MEEVLYISRSSLTIGEKPCNTSLLNAISIKTLHQTAARIDIILSQEGVEN